MDFWTVDLQMYRNKHLLCSTLFNFVVSEMNPETKHRFEHQPDGWIHLQLMSVHIFSTFLVTPVCAVLSSPLHRRASMLDFYFDHSEERPLEAFEDIFASYESKK